MKTDLLSRMRSAFGRIGDVDPARVRPVPPQRPPRIENFDSGDDETVKRILDRMEVLIIAQDEGRMKRVINARKDISDYLRIDHFVVMGVVRFTFSSRAIQMRFDRESRKG